MSDACFCPLPERGLLRVSGPDRRAFLQGLVTADVTTLSPERSLWGAFLSAQGRYLHDFFLIDTPDGILLETEAARQEDLRARLSRYRLRSLVELTPMDGLRVGVALGTTLGLEATPGATRPLPDGGWAFVDPRLCAAGVRLVLPAGASLPSPPAPTTTWHAHRLNLGLPDGSADLEIDKALPLENGFDALNGVSFTKGCYLGQELTARMHYRALIRRRLLPVRIDGPTPLPGTDLRDDANAVVGTMRSSLDGVGLALIRVESLDNVLHTEGGARLTPFRPPWFSP